MTESDKTKTSPETDLLPSATSSPLVSISHDARDAELADAFSKLLKGVSAGMIKTFRSSDKKGTDGIDFWRGVEQAPHDAAPVNLRRGLV